MRPAGKGARLTEGPIARNIFSLMLPMMLGMIAIVVNNLAGAFFIARVSTEQLAAVSFTFPVSFIVGAIAIALGTGTSSIASRLFGAGKREEVRRITGHAMALGLASALVVTVVGLLTIDPVFRLLGADENTLPLIHRYMQIYYWGGIFLVAPMIANSVLRAAGDARRPAMIMTTAAVLNIIIDPILIFGLFGFPRMEIEGAALGAVISNALTLCASVYFVMHKERLVSLRHFEPELMSDSWRRILHIGVPTLTSSLAAPLTTAFITYQVARYGHDAVAGFGMAARVEGLTLMAMMALSAAMTPFTGQNFGAGRLDRVREGVNFAYRFSLFYGIGISIALFLGGGLLADAFGLEAGARDAALLQMHIVPVSYMALGCSMTVNGALNALGRPMIAMFVSLSRTIMVYAPLAWVLSHFFGLVGIFIAAASANFVAGGIGAGWFRLVFNETRADHETRTASQQA
ncbi:MAG: MATE family efflux transporter [Gammaproteobacteria bacterium]|nr:MATE family efflux transporter [Gammaproteobacteria bacterium]